MTPKRRDFGEDPERSSAPSTPTNVPKHAQRPTPRKQSMPRVISGESNSDSFSAVFISKHNTADGGIAYAPIDMSRTELAEQLARLGMSSASQEMPPQSIRVQSSAQDPFHVPSDDLPEDLPAGTPEIMNLGEFVTVKRGGYSDDGSFRRRPLSPSPLRASSAATSIFASLQGGSRKPSMRGRRTSTPFRKPSLGQRPTVNAPSLKPGIESGPQGGRNVSSASRFGAGDMDDYEFSEISVAHDASMSRDSMPSQSPSLDVIPPGSKDPARFRFEHQDDADYGAKGKHRPGLSVTSAISVQKRTSTRRNLPTVLDHFDDTVEKNAEGKRPRTSPSKHPTPKRRRTLMTNDAANDEEEPKDLRDVEETHYRVQSAIGRKRKDSRYGSFMSRAGPDVLSQRQILRPRNPTPSQRRNDLHRKTVSLLLQSSKSHRLQMPRTIKRVRLPPAPQSRVRPKTAGNGR